MTANIDYTSPSTNFTYDVNKSNFFGKMPKI
ncbi:TPA: cupin domain-containing protein, partial [Bacillus anthracis]|nr:cupin domain-containing protein [Bacillus anthracis]